MQGLEALIRLDLLLETVSGIIALTISHYANSAFKMTEQKRLSDLSTGFLVLSVAMIGRVIGTVFFFVLPTGSQVATNVIVIVTIAHGALKVMAYVLFFISTRRSISRESMHLQDGALLMALPFLVDMRLEIVTVFVIIFVVTMSLLNYLDRRSRYALYVLVGFLFLLLSELFLIFSIDELRGYLFSQIFQFLGLIALLYMLWKAGRE